MDQPPTRTPYMTHEVHKILESKYILLVVNREYGKCSLYDPNTIYSPIPYQTLISYLEGQGDLVSRLIMGIFRAILLGYSPSPPLPWWVA